MGVVDPKNRHLGRKACCLSPLDFCLNSFRQRSAMKISRSGLTMKPCKAAILPLFPQYLANLTEHLSDICRTHHL